MADDARRRFVEQYGGIYEHSPWVAERAWEEAKDIHDPEQLSRIFARHVDAADMDAKLDLIRAHPDLADRAAVGARHAGDHPPTAELTAASREEQASAGIDQCTPEEFDRFQSLNHSYKQKFGFPFIMAVRNSNRHEILAAFETRMHNDPDTEFATAIAEIHKIARLRFAAVGARHAGDVRSDQADRRSPARRAPAK